MIPWNALLFEKTWAQSLGPWHRSQANRCLTSIRVLSFFFWFSVSHWFHNRNKCIEMKWTRTVSPTFSISASLLNDKTWDPTIGAQVLRVKTLRINGSLSPCRITMLQSWITESLLASGKTPVENKTNNLREFVHSFLITLLCIKTWETLSARGHFQNSRRRTNALGWWDMLLTVSEKVTYWPHYPFLGPITISLWRLEYFTKQNIITVNLPLRPAHSISKLKIRYGATFCHSSSAG